MLCLYNTYCIVLQLSEIVYVHSKCMVVDDRITIIGSGKVKYHYF